MTVKWPFERYTRYFSVATAGPARLSGRSAPAPASKRSRRRTLLSSVGGMATYGSDAAASLLSGTSSHSPVAQAVIDLARDGSGNTRRPALIVSPSSATSTARPT